MLTTRLHRHFIYRGLYRLTTTTTDDSRPWEPVELKKPSGGCNTWDKQVLRPLTHLTVSPSTHSHKSTPTRHTQTHTHCTGRALLGRTRRAHREHYLHVTPQTHKQTQHRQANKQADKTRKQSGCCTTQGWKLWASGQRRAAAPSAADHPCAACNTDTPTHIHTHTHRQRGHRTNDQTQTRGENKEREEAGGGEKRRGGESTMARMPANTKSA